MIAGGFASFRHMVPGTSGRAGGAIGFRTSAGTEGVTGAGMSAASAPAAWAWSGPIAR